MAKISDEKFDWHAWFVPPIVIPGALIVWFLAYLLYQHL
jgi:hypothetical protein